MRQLSACLGVAMSLTALALLGALALVGPSAGADPSLLYVSPSGAAGAADVSCSTASYSTINAAVAAAPGAATVVVCPGTYTESVTISTRPLRLRGISATVDASGLASGVVIEGPAAAGSSLQGFQVENAEQAGVVVQGTSDITVSGNSIVDNDRACSPQPSAVVDCGEGLHLEAVTNSVVSGNQLRGNTGGVLLDDRVPASSVFAGLLGGPTPYAGPSTGNRILFNVAEDNPYYCGITLASHNSLPVSTSGTPQPGLAGVFGNTVIGNTSDDNGTADGNGSGILLAARLPGMGTYDNLVVANRASGNGLAGITIHSHASGQDVNGNRLVANVLGQNAVDGGGTTFGAGPPGDSAAGVNNTAGIVIWSAVTPITNAAVVANTIDDDYDGVWMHTTADTELAGDHFFDVSVPLTSS